MQLIVFIIRLFNELFVTLLACTTCENRRLRSLQSTSCSMGSSHAKEHSQLSSKCEDDKSYSAAAGGDHGDGSGGKCSATNWREFGKRAGLLSLLCVLNLGFWYTSESPTALESAIKGSISGSREHFDYILHVSSWPGVLLTPAAGIFMDRVLGVPLGTVVYSAVALLGQVLFVAGGYADMFWLMLVGRFFFSAGEKMVIVATHAYIASCFKNKELAMAFGAIHAVTRISDILSANIDANLYHALGSISQPPIRLGTTLMFSLFLCILSVVCAVAVFILDCFVLRVKVTDSNIVEPKQCCKVVKCKPDDLKDFKIPFWLIVGSALVYYTTLMPFIHVSVRGILLERKYLYTSENVKALQMAVFAVSALASPFLGILIDYVGFHLSWFILAIFATLLCHISLGFSGEEYVCPIFSLIFIGIAIALISITIPALTAYLVRNHQLGTAYGIIHGLTKFSPHFALITVTFIVNNVGYLILEIMFSGLVLLSLLLSVLLLAFDTTVLGGALNLSAWARASLIRAEQLGRKAKYKFEELPEAWTSVNFSHHGLTHV